MNWLVQHLGTAIDFLLVVIGFSLIVFIHELGHFVAARWAGIRVMAFAIGFGPAVFSYRKGMGWRRGSSEREYLARVRQSPDSPDVAAISPTEYRWNALPFGGYVKMLGQDDLNPSAVSSAKDSYQMCPPWRRMVVISAGVIANVITAAFLFVVVYMVGLKVEPAKIGAVDPGSPASHARVVDTSGRPVPGGLQPGDVVTSIEGRRSRSFNDVVFGTAMAGRDEQISLTLERDGAPLAATMKPEFGRLSGLLEIGIGPAWSTMVSKSASEKTIADAGLPGVKPGMILSAIDGRQVGGLHELEVAVRHGHGQPLTLTFRGEAGATVDVAITPRPQLETGLIEREDGAISPIDHLLGLMPVISIKEARPGPDGPNAADQGFQNGDIFARLGDVEFPSVAQGMSTIKASKGKTIAVTVLRRNPAGGWNEVTLPQVKVSGKGAIGFLVGDTGDESALIAAPLPTITPMQADRKEYEPAASRLPAAAGMEIVAVGDRSVETLADVRDALLAQTAGSTEDVTVELRIRRPVKGVPDPNAPIETVRWSLTSADLKDLRALGWANPVPEALFEPLQVVDRAANPLDAVTRGVSDTHRVMMTTYLTFKRLIVDRTVKVEHLKGPVGIAHLGTLVAGRGFIWLLFFLALISVNLAVINFLPLPIVDGGQFLFLLYEQIRGRPAPIVVQNALTLAGLALIACVFLVVTFNDVKNLFGL